MYWCHHCCWCFYFQVLQWLPSSFVDCGSSFFSSSSLVGADNLLGGPFPRTQSNPTHEKTYPTPVVKTAICVLTGTAWWNNGNSKGGGVAFFSLVSGLSESLEDLDDDVFCSVIYDDAFFSWSTVVVLVCCWVSSPLLSSLVVTNSFFCENHEHCNYVVQLQYFIMTYLYLLVSVGKLRCKCTLPSAHFPDIVDPQLVHASDRECGIGSGGNPCSSLQLSWSQGWINCVCQEH